MPSDAFMYVTGLERGVRPIGDWSTRITSSMNSAPSRHSQHGADGVPVVCFFADDNVLYQALSSAKKQTTGTPSAPCWECLEGAEFIDEVILVDQSPIGRTPRSNPVTYIKAFDGIRELFASLPEAKKRGLTAGHFSFNVPGGRCEVFAA